MGFGRELSFPTCVSTYIIFIYIHMHCIHMLIYDICYKCIRVCGILRSRFLEGSNKGLLNAKQ